MKEHIFRPTNVLLPEGVSMEKWSVVACDQFSSEHDYWERVQEIVEQAPSTLSMIIPEAFLEDIDEEQETKKISETMAAYLAKGLFKEIPNSYVYVQRTQPDGRIRHGIVGAMNLDEYDFAATTTPIRASEGTVLDRLPPRIKIRRMASLELPHIMTFIDDADDLVLGPLAKKAESLPVLYDFDLMEGGGHIKGMMVTGADAEKVMEAIQTLNEKNDMLMVIGDGNHSLAAAKVYWDEIKKTLSEDERQKHPAGYALVEVNNVYDKAIDFEAIHRIAFDVSPKEFISAMEKAMKPGSDYIVHWVTKDGEGQIGIAADCIGDMLTEVQKFLDEYAENPGCRIDYIHGEDSVRKLAYSENAVGLILPAMEKADLFDTVAVSGVFPKKSFSVGHARDKRYYLECRKITIH